jgi:glutamine synthetase
MRNGDSGRRSPPRAAKGKGASFAERHGLWSDERAKLADEVERRIASEGLEVVRLSFADQHGILRGKTLVAGEVANALRNGCGFVTTLLAKDTAHRTVFPVFDKKGGGFARDEMQGAADALMLPDPATFRVLPWAERTGWLLCDLFFPSGEAVGLSTRGLYRRVLERLGEAGYDFMAGLEIEFYLFKLENPRLSPEDAGQPGTPPEVSLLGQGYNLLTETRFDALEPALEILRRDIAKLGLKLRSLECEYGPSQVEFTFRAETGMAPADAMVLFRSATKQICRRHGYHASFMCRPRLPNVMSSGWHLHQSLIDRRTGKNVFVPGAGEILSPVSRPYLAGLVEHAAASAAFATPTINGYKRYRPYSLAPDRAIWGRDNRGVMVRVLGGPGDEASRLENRVGEPAANPYLYMASQIVAGLDGIERRLDPGPPTETPYDNAAPLLPRTLGEAIAALRASACFRAGFGDAFIDYFAHIKDAELARFHLDVTEWEQREYFELF